MSSHFDRSILWIYEMFSSLLLAESKEGANSLFEEVLKRKDHADATRNALNVMQRFKFLFHLPCNIERNINKVCLLHLIVAITVFFRSLNILSFLRVITASS